MAARDLFEVGERVISTKANPYGVGILGTVVGFGTSHNNTQLVRIRRDDRKTPNLWATNFWGRLALRDKEPKV